MSQTFSHKVKYLHSHGIPLQWSIRKLWQIFSNECHWSRNGKIDIDVFYFLGVIKISWLCHKIFALA